MELLNTLGIDWKLLIVQLINFVLLIGVLTFLLYRPILRVLDERKARIQKSMEDAKKVEQMKKDMDDVRKEQMKKLDQETGKLLEAARKQADDMKKEMITRAQEEAAGIVAKAQEQLGAERGRMVSEIQSTLANIVVQMTEKVLQREFAKGDQDRILGSIKQDLPALLK